MTIIGFTMILVLILILIKITLLVEKLHWSSIGYVMRVDGTFWNLKFSIGYLYLLFIIIRKSKNKFERLWKL